MPPSRWLKRLAASAQARRQRPLRRAVRKSSIVRLGRAPLASCYHGQWIAKLLSPVCELRDHVRMGVPSPLPECKIRKLNRERRKGRFRSGGEGVVQSGQFVREHAERPAVAEDLVH